MPRRLIDVPHPVLGMLKMQGVFPRLSETPGEVRSPGLTLGQDTAEVLGDILGLGSARLAELGSHGVV